MNSDSQSDLDWQSSRRVLESNQYMLTNHIGCDISLVMGVAKDIVSAHKYMLISRSSVFEAMFCGPLAEAGTQVVIPDIEADIMKLFLGFIYTEHIHLTPDTVMAVMYTAKKYCVPLLVTDCRTYLQKEMANDNVCTILEHANLFEETELKGKCLKIIFTNCKDVLSGEFDDFKNLSSEGFKLILESDKLIMSEELIYSACLEWAKEHCKRKNIEVTDENLRLGLGDLIYLIRFSNMSPEFFTSNVSVGNILTAEEKVTLFQQFNSLNHKDNELVTSDFKFSSKQRISKLVHRANRFLKVIGGTFDFWVNDNLIDAISFSCSRDINLSGVSVFSPFHGVVKGCFRLYDSTNLCMIKRDDLELSSAEGENTIDVEFPKSVLIKQREWYTVTQQLLGANSYLGMKGQKKVVDNSLEFYFRKSPMDENNTNKDSGQIPALLYKFC